MDRRQLLLRGIALGFSVPVLTKIAMADSMTDAQAIVTIKNHPAIYLTLSYLADT